MQGSIGIAPVLLKIIGMLNVTSHCSEVLEDIPHYETRQFKNRTNLLFSKALVAALSQ